MCQYQQEEGESGEESEERTKGRRGTEEVEPYGLRVRSQTKRQDSRMGTAGVDRSDENFS